MNSSREKWPICVVSGLGISGNKSRLKGREDSSGNNGQDVL